MRNSESEYIPPFSEQIADHEDPFIDALFESPLFQSRRSQSQTKKQMNFGGDHKRERKNTMATKSYKQYSPAEKAAYNLGRGSTLSRTEEGRKKHVMKMMKGDPALIASYKRGRQKGLKDKKAYLDSKRRNKK